VENNTDNQFVTAFRLNTVTYGNALTRFLAILSLQQLVYDFEGTHPHIAIIIARDFYVDDTITGESSMQELFKTKTQVTGILKIVFIYQNFVSTCHLIKRDV